MTKLKKKKVFKRTKRTNTSVYMSFPDQDHKVDRYTDLSAFYLKG